MVIGIYILHYITFRPTDNLNHDSLSMMTY